MEITGKTKILPIIGDPIEGVFSPPVFNAWFAVHDIDCTMIPLRVPTDALSAFWSVLRASDSFLGCSVTYPHKRAAFEAVDQMTDRAARLGALNTIRRSRNGKLTGDATDGEAMLTAIERNGGIVAGKTATILGAAGGAGTAIADAFCEKGIGRLVLIDTDRVRLDGLTGLLKHHWPDVELSLSPMPAEILVNATTIGKTTQDPIAFDPDQIAAAQIICDVVTSDGPTRLIETARITEKIAVSGADMGSAQRYPQCHFLGL